MEQENLNKSRPKAQLLLLIQIILCILSIIFMIATKYVFPNLFTCIKDWYTTSLNDSILTPAIVENQYKQEEIDKIEENQDMTKTSSIDDDKNITSNQTMFTPVEGIVTSDFGERIDPATGKKKFHKGIDIAAPKNTLIKCALNGKVIKVGNNSSYGKHIIVEHDNNIRTLYAHCNKIIVDEDKQITAGQEIALVGSTGDSSGNHLHFEVIVDDKCQDPNLYISTSMIKNNLKI